MKPFQYYASNGYYVARSAVPLDLIRPVADAFRAEIKPSTIPLLRQSTQYEPNRLDEHGFVTQALLDPHLHAPDQFSKFKRAVLDLACSETIALALSRITLRRSHWLQQIMVFEQSVTAAHQDCVYLDSAPAGFLTAAWIALEDIHPEATRFFVIPGSQDFAREFPEPWIFESHRYMDAMDQIVRAEYADRITIPEMRAGDVLFWNSHTIHGSLKGTDPTRSRLSLTAHYVPEGFGMGRRGKPLERAYPFPLVDGRPIPYLDRSLL